MFDRRKREDELERELRNHLDLEAEEQGGDAWAARRALGNVGRIQEETRESWGYQWLDRLAQDLRYGVRVLAKNRGFAAVAIVTAALGIGANTAIFSVIDAVLRHPLLYREAERLVTPVVLGNGPFVAAYQYAAWRDQATVFDGFAAYASPRLTLTGDGGAEQLGAQAVTPGFLRLLGVSPAIGRDFTEADTGLDRGTVALISHSLWTKRFHGDPGILAHGITLDGKLYTVAGVLPRSFEFPENVDVSVLVPMPEPMAVAVAPRASAIYRTIARLKPGITAERAAADLRIIDDRLRTGAPTLSRTQVTGLHDRLVGNVRPALVVLAGAVGLVLLIVCVNISNLLLARALARQKEIAVRIALGAGRTRVFRQLITEGLLLAAAGGAGGVVVAAAGVRLLRAIAPEGVPHIADARLGGTVLAFNFAVAVGVGILFGLAPLRSASRLDPETALKQASRSATGARTRRRLEGLLVVAETAFALILVAGAGLLLRTFAGLTAIAPGFQPENVMTATISLPSWKYKTPDRQRAFFDDLLQRVRSGPGVEAAGAAAVLPYGGWVMKNWLQVEGRASDAPRSHALVNYTAGDYLRAMGMRLIEGRFTNASDTAERTPVVVINQEVARRFFPGVSPVGKRIEVVPFTPWLEVVGVITSVKQGGLASEAEPEIFPSAVQGGEFGTVSSIVVRSTADARVVLPWLRAQIASMDKDIPPAELDTMRGRMAALMNTQVFVMRLLLLFAGIAIVLAAIGIYSVLAYSVERRLHEIGIRMALGARRGHIVGMVVGRGFLLASAGAGLGVVGGLAVTRYLKTLLYGVTPHDPVTMAAGCAVVIAVALVAAYLPARKAVDQDAVATLRGE
jgi:putative ABC transport system permease protein